MSLLDAFRLDAKVVVVTGASSGLGAGFARAVAGVGASVVVTARRRDRLDLLVDELAEGGTQVLAVTADVASSLDCSRVVEDTMRRFGRLDVLVNNAGTGSSVPASQESPEAFAAVVGVNLTGTYAMARACALVMPAGSSIVNVASIHGSVAAPFPHAAYIASKAGVLGLTRDLAQQWTGRRGIRVNALCPGYFVSEMTGQGGEFLRDVVARRSIMGRFGEQHELDAALVFLASGASSYMTGASLVVDGGYTAV